MARKRYSTASSPPPPPYSIPILKTPVTHQSSSSGRTLMEGFAFGAGSSIALSMSRIFDTSSSSSKINKNTLNIEDDQGKNKQPVYCLN
jgi:hypothetical protein